MNAVQMFLDNPRKQEVKRDIGEPLSRTMYEDDINLYMDEYDEDSDDDLSGFIVPDSAIESGESTTETVSLSLFHCICRTHQLFWDGSDSQAGDDNIKNSKSSA